MKLSEMTNDQRGAYHWLTDWNESFDQRTNGLLVALKRYIRAMGGFVYMSNDNHTQTVLVCEENLDDWHQDQWKENYIYALKLDENDNLLMFCEEIFSNYLVIWTEDEIKTYQDEDCNHWYVLDWDCSNAFLHNLGRITNYLLNDEITTDE